MYSGINMLTSIHILEVLQSVRQTVTFSYLVLQDGLKLLDLCLSRLLELGGFIDSSLLQIPMPLQVVLLEDVTLFELQQLSYLGLHGFVFLLEVHQIVETLHKEVDGVA